MVAVHQLLSPQLEKISQPCKINHRSPLEMAHFLHQVTHSHLRASSLISAENTTSVSSVTHFNAGKRCTSVCYGWISLSSSFFQEHMELVGDILRTHSLPSILTASPIPSPVRNYTFKSPHTHKRS